MNLYANIKNNLKESANQPVYVICYGNLEVWPDKESAMNFYKEGIYASEGAERDRYVNICLDLEDGSTIAEDGDGELINTIVYRDRDGKVISRKNDFGTITPEQAIKHIKKLNDVKESEVPKKYERGNAPFESKRVPEDKIREEGYLYFSTHGTGPGTKPKDVRVREMDWDLPSGWVAIKTDRPLTSEELSYYDIQPETRNNEFRKRFHLEESSKETKKNRKPIKLNDDTEQRYMKYVRDWMDDRNFDAKDELSYWSGKSSGNYDISDYKKMYDGLYDENGINGELFVSYDEWLNNENLEESQKIKEAVSSKGLKSPENNEWIKGEVTVDGKPYYVQGKVYEEPSEFGIDNSEVSKLWINELKGNDLGRTVVAYDRGWDKQPRMSKDKKVLQEVLKMLIDFRSKNHYMDDFELKEAQKKTTEKSSEDKCREIFNKYRDEFDTINDVRDIADYINGLYADGGMNAVENWFLPAATDEYKKDLKSLINKK